MPSLPPHRVLAAPMVMLLAACQDLPKSVSGPPSCAVYASPTAAPGHVPDTSPYDAVFAAAGSEFGVPAELLRAIGYVETGWQMVEGHEEFAGMPAAHGIMALRGERLREGALLAGLDEEAVRTDAAANVRAAAALLRAWADSLGIRGDDSDAWAPVVARYSGIGMAAGQGSYVAEVSAVRGGRRAVPAAEPRSAAFECGTTPPPPAADQAGALWRESPNYNARMSGEGGQVHMVIIHSCEGSYAGCWSWLAQSASQVSAHYVVREDGAEITQLVRESSRAWHIGATYDSTLNQNHDGRLHGIQSNHFTIGVEHAGYASQATWPEEQIDASAKLVCDVARRWQIPRDRLHIVSHGQLQPWNRTDPGANWPWADYIARIDRYCTA
ncbi:MAG TPA: peptidoglycan recognition family protein [Gemmatimonadaceae bacterium]|nr:peptidoglycan recognition family protein [Gemmatimonadaceae bacterium]